MLDNVNVFGYCDVFLLFQALPKLTVKTTKVAHRWAYMRFADHQPGHSSVGRASDYRNVLTEIRWSLVRLRVAGYIFLSRLLDYADDIILQLCSAASLNQDVAPSPVDCALY